MPPGPSPSRADGSATLVLTAVERGQETIVSLAGPLDVTTEAGAWQPFSEVLSRRPPGRARLIFDLKGLTALDLNGSAQIIAAREVAEKVGLQVTTIGLSPRLEVIFRLAQGAMRGSLPPAPARVSFWEEVGRSAEGLARDLKALTFFLGELTAEFMRLVIRPWRFNWRGVAVVAERSGINAVPIVALVSFLVGLIIAFQAAMITRIFGAEIYVATLVGVSVVRELGPLIAAIVLAGRSGSAFSAELGAMRVAEEIDALTTMGLSPVRELALPRVLAQVITTPGVTLIACLVGIFGGSLVLLGLGYTAGTYWSMAVEKVSLATFLIGFFKSFVFGFTVGAVGCQRGLAAGDGPGAVGEATTSGVVTNIVVIAILDSLFAVVFYVVGV
ncbi:MAG: ABC transporter permease [Candidatus Adiutrix sp.]|nr:ABC transporter permease [Candidatus Adiutrix sp.]